MATYAICNQNELPPITKRAALGEIVAFNIDGHDYLVSVENIDVKFAESFIANFPNNRNTRQGNVANIACAIDEARYSLTHQPIAIFENNESADGFHRASGVIKSKTKGPILSFVVRNLPLSCKENIDECSGRTPVDRIVMAGLEHPGALALCQTLLFKIDTGSLGRGLGHKLDGYARRMIHEKHPAIFASINWAVEISKQRDKNQSKVVDNGDVAFVHYCGNRAGHKELTERVLTAVVTGSCLDSAPEFVLRSQLLNRALSRKKSPTNRSEVVAWSFKMINSIVSGKPMKHLKMHASEPFPRLIGYPYEDRS